MLDLGNGICHDDLSKITGVKKIKNTVIVSDGYALDMYIIKFNYNDGTNKFMRVFCEPGTSNMLTAPKTKGNFFVNRLFGEDGLIVKEGRNDYIYLGEVYDNGERITRFRKNDKGITRQEEFDAFFKESILPNLTLKGNPSDFDVVDIEYAFHTGREDMEIVFKEGIKNSAFFSGPSFGSTFFPAEEGSILNNLEDAAKRYGKITSKKGPKVFITRVPKEYRAKSDGNGGYYPPLPTSKIVEPQKGISIIIPEIIYGMYDTKTGILQKNPNYNLMFNPDGLVYDHEVIEKFRCAGDYKMERFMIERNNHTYKELKKRDEELGTFNNYCSYYGIDRKSSNSKLKNFLTSMRENLTNINNDIFKKR